MKLRQSRNESADINLTPLIDVVFLLLIFFMVSTTFDRQSELTIDLPEATAEETEERPRTVEIAIDPQGRYFIDGRALINTQVATIKKALLEAAGDDGPVPVVISADANSPHQSVVAVMDAARQIGFVRLTFATRAVQREE